MKTHYFAKINGNHDYCGRSMKTRPCANTKAAREAGWRKAHKADPDLKEHEVERYFSVIVYEKSPSGEVRCLDRAH